MKIPPTRAKDATVPARKAGRTPQKPPSAENRVVIEAVEPEIDCGASPAKRIVGEAVVVTADIFSDGHEVIAADLLWRRADEIRWNRSPMRFVENDRWAGSFPLAGIGRHVFTIEAWRDPFASLMRDLARKQEAGQDVAVELAEGAALVRAAGLGETDLDGLLSPATAERMARSGERRHLSRYARVLTAVADRPAARFSSWYELFPRSQSGDPARHGTFDDVIARLPYIHDLGFDVLYMPPIHPIGRTNRKGRNNSLVAAADDPGSVYAIGSDEGGHDAVHPELGGIEAFDRLVAAAAERGIEIALDFAIQCSPDHPWISQHPEWFEWRPDGTIRFAENPPKRYEDIVNVHFYGDAFPDLWFALRDVVLFWVGHGVRIFRVDNPHTKPLPFWEWLIRDVNERHPDVLFLAEAFTRPKMMRKLAKVGFQQSYTYFTWRTGKQELADYARELAGPSGEFYRPNYFVNTPDINPVYLQASGRAGFMVRATLAATLSGVWGVYSGFELCEATPLPGREEYLDSEKYEIRAWDWDRPGNIKDHIRALNRIRRDNPALQDFRNILILNAWNDRMLAYARFAADGHSCVLVIVNLDPHHRQECDFEIPLWEFGLPDWEMLQAEDLLEGHVFPLRGKIQHVGLDPAERTQVIWRLSAPQMGGRA